MPAVDCKVSIYDNVFIVRFYTGNILEDSWEVTDLEVDSLTLQYLLSKEAYEVIA